MSEHTKGPWKVEIETDDGSVHICHPNTVDDTTTVNYELTEANAKRIVACVNACDGISNETLSAHIYDKIIITKQEYHKIISRISFLEDVIKAEK